MNLHSFLANYLQFFLFPLSQIGYRLSTRKKDQKEWAFLLQLFTQAVWIVWAFSVNQGWATLGSFSYAGQYIWNYLERKHPQVTDRVSAAFRRMTDPVSDFVRRAKESVVDAAVAAWSLLPHKEKEHVVVEG